MGPESIGELKKIDYSDNTPEVEYTYTRSGQLETVTDTVGMRTFAYNDELDLMTETIDGSGDGLYSTVITRKY